MRGLLLSTLLLGLSFGTPALGGDDSRSVWRGTWVNRRTSSAGPMQMVVKEIEGNIWRASFTGKQSNEPFSYEASFKSRPGGRVTRLAGVATIDGHDYQWSGTIRGNQLVGTFRANIGWYGEFRLTEGRRVRSSQRPAN